MFPKPNHVAFVFLVGIALSGCGGRGGGGNTQAAVQANNPPTATSLTANVDQNSSVPVTLSGFDPDGNALTYMVVGSPANGTLSGTAPNLTYTPNAGFSGPDSFTYTVSDGTATSNVATVSITVLTAFTIHDIDTNVGFRPSIDVADVDSDGDLDVLSADDSVRWHENDGSQNFVTHTIDTNSVRANAVLASDVDGDGDVDVVSAQPGVRWFENDGNEAFTLHSIFDGPGTDTSVYPIDLDGDGDIDVLSTSSYAVRWFENDGSEAFTGHDIVNGGSTILEIEFVTASDVDSDGDLDVLAGYSLAGAVPNIRWYENDGNEAFTEHYVSVGEISRSSTIQALDVDGDGDIDVVSAETVTDQLVWYENDGNQTFTAHHIADGSTGDSAFAVDFDADGDIDVVNSAGAGIDWWENDGSSAFTAHYFRPLTLRTGTIAVNAVDLDLDGDIDVVGAWLQDGIISWFETGN